MRGRVGSVAVSRDLAMVTTRVQIPADALPSVVRRPTSRSLHSRESRPTHFCGEHHGEHRERQRAGPRETRVARLPVLANPMVRSVPADALPSVVRRPISRSLHSRESRPTHFCEAQSVSGAERQRGVANNHAPREIVTRDLNPASRAQRVKRASTSGSGSNPGRRTPFGRASPDFSLAPLARIPADAFLWRPHREQCRACMRRCSLTREPRNRHEYCIE